MGKLLEKRIANAKLRLEDLNYDTSMWGWSFTPSQDIARASKVRDLKIKIRNLEAKR